MYFHSHARSAFPHEGNDGSITWIRAGGIFGLEEHSVVREQIARSWQRSASSGLEPAHTLESASLRDVDR